MSPEHCDSCTLDASRRSFIRDTSLAIAGALASVGLTRRAAAELIVSAIAPIASTATAHTYPIPATDGAHIDQKEEVILVRWLGTIYAFNLSCPHQNTALRWLDKDHRFSCPKHHSRYEPNGTFIDGRATRGMDRFSVSIDGSNVVVDVNAMHKQDKDPQGWAAAMVKVA